MGNWNLQGAVIPVTGAASGIGLAICEQLRDEGATPLLIDSDVQKLRGAAGQVYKGVAEPSRYAYELDVTDSRAVDECLAKIQHSHGSVTHAVASAGVGGPATNALNVTDEQWHRVINVNLNGAMYFCRAVARQLAERKAGAIVTIASIAGLSAKEDRIGYAASKAGVINMTRALAVDLGSSHVRANAIAPGVIDTPMQDRNRNSFQGVSEGIPLRRVGNANEIASAVLFLLSDYSSYITGATVVVDGGITAKYR